MTGNSIQTGTVCPRPAGAPQTESRSMGDGAGPIGSLSQKRCLTSMSLPEQIKADGESIYRSVPLEKRGVFLCLLRPKTLDYAARFLKKCNEICGICMPFYAMKLRELAKNAGNCEKCSFRWRSRRVITGGNGCSCVK